MGNELVYSDNRSRCDDCRKLYSVKETTRRLAQDADNPLFVREVIQHFAERYGQSLAMVEFICPSCVQDRWDQVLEDNSVQYDSRGFVILSDNDEFFGRREDEQGSSVVTKPKQVSSAPKAGPAEVSFTAGTSRSIEMLKGDYKGKTGTTLGSVVKGYWKGIRVQLSTGKQIDVQETSFKYTD